MKKKAEKAGFIKTKKKYRELMVFNGPNNCLKESFGYQYPEQEKKIRFKTAIRQGKQVVIMYEQLHDEIISKMEFKRVKNIVKSGKNGVGKKVVGVWG